VLESGLHAPEAAAGEDGGGEAGPRLRGRLAFAAAEREQDGRKKKSLHVVFDAARSKPFPRHDRIEDMSLEQNKSMVRRLVDEAQTQGQFDVVDELMADDFVDHSPLPGLPPTREGVKMLFAGLRAAFPDLHVTISEQIAEDERVATRKTFRGTHRGDFLGVPASGRPVEFEVIDILTFERGKITEHRVVLDQLGLLRQLGAM
jgi:steroid delta-isomerase-like uncharacterized protein